jgi:hypothetical protein
MLLELPLECDCDDVGYGVVLAAVPDCAVDGENGVECHRFSRDPGSPWDALLEGTLL